MAQIGALPIDEPVEKPHASPQEFGSVGRTIAGLGQETEDLAAGTSEVAGHLIAAQRQVHAKQAEISFDRVKMQVYNDLNKTTSPEEAQAVYEHSKGELDNVLTPFEHDKVLARSLGLYRQQQDVEIQGTVNAKKADIITKSDRAANELLGQKSLNDAITTTVGGGDPSIPRAQFTLQLQSSVAHGTMLPNQAKAVMEQWDQDYEKGLIEAYSNSPSPATRKQNIANLKAGDSIPHLDKATTNALLTKAMSRDRELTNLAESQDYNEATNHFDQLTKGWEYESKVKALEDGDWLKNNGFVDESGQPDRKKADMLLEEADRQENRKRKIQTDKDNEVIDKYVDQADSGKMSDSQIDQQVRQDGGSPKASATLRSVLRQHVREARSDAREDRAEARAKRQDAALNGQGTSADLYRRMSEGGSIDPITDIWDKVDSGDMSVAQAKSVQAAYKKAQHEDFSSNLRKIQTEVPDKDTQGKLSQQLTDAVNQQNLQGKAMSDFTDKLLKEHAEQHATGLIQRLWNSITSGSIAQPLPTAAKPAPGSPAPKEGDTKTNSSGDTVKFHDGKWGPA